MNETAKENSGYCNVIMGICNLEVPGFSIAPLFSISFYFAHATVMTTCEVGKFGSFTESIVVGVESFESQYPDHWQESNMSFIYISKLLCNHIYQYAMLS